MIRALHARAVAYRDRSIAWRDRELPDTFFAAWANLHAAVGELFVGITTTLGGGR